MPAQTPKHIQLEQPLRPNRASRFDPGLVAVQIADLLGTELPDPCATGVDPSERLRRLAALTSVQGRLTTLRRQLANEFGRRNGWELSQSQFAADTLQAGRIRDTKDSLFSLWPLDLIDHRFFYRHPDRRAAALVAHPYDVSLERRGLTAGVTNNFSLLVSFPDFPSWWSPGCTTLVLFERVQCS